MKITFKKKEYEINEITHRQRLELIGVSAGVAGTDGQVVHGEGFGKFLVKIFELSGLKDSDFEGMSESEYIEFINKIHSAWKLDAKK